jgi:predicted ATP-grasp superfamily ATP-dependent carboligase
MSRAKTVLLLDGECRAALAVVRALGSAGLKVVVSSEYPDSLAGSSRYCYHSVQYPSPFTDLQQFLQCIRDLIKNEKIDVLFPVTDASTYAILKHQPEFEKFIPFSSVPFEKYWAASDKINLIRIGRELGIPVPESSFVDPAGKDGIEEYLQTLAFPLILKPQASIFQNLNQLQKTSVRFASSREELLQIVKNDPSFSKPYMLQEVISGDGIGIFTFCLEGEILHVFSHKRIREKPPYGGISVVCESTEPDPSALESSKKLLKALNWSGIAMVEFKRDKSRNNVPILMEINARFWGSLQLAIDAGVNFPLYQYNLLCSSQNIQKEDLLKKNTGEKASRSKHARSRWLLGDLDHLFIRLKTSAKDPRYPQSIKDKLYAILIFFLEFLKCSKIEEFRYGDIGPFRHALKRWVKAL